MPTLYELYLEVKQEFSATTDPAQAKRDADSQVQDGLNMFEAFEKNMQALHDRSKRSGFQPMLANMSPKGAAFTQMMRGLYETVWATASPYAAPPIYDEPQSAPEPVVEPVVEPVEPAE